jgi:predicted nucleotidyltransferase
MTRFPEMIRALTDAGVEFILIGGVAAAAHGSVRTTEDLDIVYRRTPDNIARLVEALRGLDPYLRGVPPGLPFRWDARTIERGLNFTLTTTLGAIDLLGEVTGGGSYDELIRHCVPAELYGARCECVSLPRLIHLKRCAGRAKDLVALSELEALLEENRKLGEDGQSR